MVLRISLAIILTFAISAAHARADSSLSPAGQRIERARKFIDRSPKRPQGYNELAMALSQRARETSDPSFYAQAEEAAEQSLKIAPGNLEARRARAWVWLGQHRFEEALKEAEELNRLVPDDLIIYGLLVDAQVELGRYAEAEAAAQWMLDLRPGNIPGLTRAAYLRELFGDLDGAIELMLEAFHRTPLEESEDRAWILTQLAHLHFSSGKVDSAATLAEEALRAFPDYHYALAQLGRVRSAQGKHSEAVAAFQARHKAAPHPENLYELAEALARAGQEQEAAWAFLEFERAAAAESASVDNANRELVFYYLDHAHRPAEALALARREAARRQDVFTLDAHAWALSANGFHGEARAEIGKALSVGIRDAGMFYRAGLIALRQNDPEAARKFLKASLAVNPMSPHSPDARSALAELESTASNSPIRLPAGP